MMNDKTKLVKEVKKDKASRCCWSAYQNKIRQNGIRRNAIRRHATQPRFSCFFMTACVLFDAADASDAKVKTNR